MPASTTTEATTTVLVDLVVHDFDQWSNPAEPMFAPSTICWYGYDTADGTE